LGERFPLWWKNEIGFLIGVFTLKFAFMSVPPVNSLELSPIQQMLSNIWVASGIKVDSLTFVDKFERLDLSLGKSLIPSERAPSTSYGVEDFYIIGEGQVRLLVNDPSRGREVTVRVMGPGEWFGADDLLCPQAQVPYRALGITNGHVYCLPRNILSLWLGQYPQLQVYLSAVTCEYQRTAFLRTAQGLQAISGTDLRALAHQVQDCLIPAKTQIADFLPDQAGIFWLRSGRILSYQGTPPYIGEYWIRQATALPLDWQADTDLFVSFLATQVREDLDGRGSPLESALNDLGLSNSYGNSRNPRGASSVHQTNNRVKLLAPLKVNQVDPAPFVESRGENGANGTNSNQDLASAFPRLGYRRSILSRFRRFPWIEQQNSSDCGVACLAMICRYWGKSVSLSTVREQANVRRSGATLQGLSKAAELIGFQARPVRASLDRIAKQPTPWIAHWQGDHYIVVYKIARNAIIIADPAEGKRSISRERFQQGWTGYALLLQPTANLRSTGGEKASLGRYARLIIPYFPLAFQILVISILVQVFSLITPLFTQIILDKVVVQKSLSTLNVFAVGLFVFGFWAIAMEAVRNYLVAHVSTRLDLAMVTGFVKHAISLPLKFYDTRRVGDIITRVQENQKIQRFLVSQLMATFLSVLTGFVYLVLMSYYNIGLTLLILLFIPPIAIITLISTPFLRDISRKVFKEAANQNSILVELINGIAAIKSASVEQEVRWQWEGAVTQFQNVTFKGYKFGIGLETINRTVNVIATASLLWLGARMVILNELTVGQFVAFNMMIGYILNPVVALANLWDQLQEVLISVERLNDVFEAEPEQTSEQSALTLPEIDGQVTFEKVTFSYDSETDQNVLENISFTVQPGQTIAIVGRSGSGKTTLVKLLERLYNPTQGRILVDGHDIRNVSTYSLRIQIGIVPQECFLFSGTILDNIVLYRQGITLEAAIEAAKLAEAHAFIQRLPLGYSTKVGERGSTLSGGQRQRIAIARALLGNPRILILDEATSSLDTESERRFQSNLAQISRNRTTFIIAHRLSTVRNADYILVLDRGVLVEQGSHQQLMDEQGLYYTLISQQLNT
jgi:ATP-binding cassette subfamily B protein